VDSKQTQAKVTSLNVSMRKQVSDTTANFTAYYRNYVYLLPASFSLAIL
jgi:hypothetical protein